MSIKVIDQELVERTSKAVRAKVDVWLDEAIAEAAEEKDQTFIVGIYLAATATLHNTLLQHLVQGGGKVTEHVLSYGKKEN